ncbi:MAG: uroporphyrinogen-III synthase, partial [Gemmatimonadaceae bacterium]
MRERMDNLALTRDRLLARLLEGRRVVVTRSGSAGETLVKRLESLGATVIHCPTISFAPPQDVVALMHALAGAADHDWIAFTSANAVQSVAQALRTMFGTYDVPLPPIAVVGRASAEAVESFGWRVAFMPSKSSGEQLAALMPVSTGMRVLLPRADIASTELPALLRERGCVVNEVVAYRTLTNAQPVNSALLRGGDPIDALTFTSPSTVAGFIQTAHVAGWNAVVAQRSGELSVVCIGETTAAAARQHNLVVDAIAAEPSIESLIDALA